MVERALPSTLVGALSLVERLGHRPNTAVLIITVDGLGTSHAATAAGHDALRNGLATSAGLVVPGPWARWSADAYGGEDIGVQLTVNAAHPLVRWGPLTHAPTLGDGAGAFPRTPADLGEHADDEELRREVRAQLERAGEWGIDVTHLSVHLDALWLRPELFDVVLEVAVANALPVRPPTAALEATLGFPLRALAAAEGIICPDRVVRATPGRTTRLVLEAALDAPRPGVTEVIVTPALDTPEHRALAGADGAGPGVIGDPDDYVLVTSDAYIAAKVASSGVVLTGWRALRDAQRA